MFTAITKVWIGIENLNILVIICYHVSKFWIPSLQWVFRVFLYIFSLNIFIFCWVFSCTLFEAYICQASKWTVQSSIFSIYLCHCSLLKQCIVVLTEVMSKQLTIFEGFSFFLWKLQDLDLACAKYFHLL